ncbi:hypothetical protein AYO21_01697 [Fonsecaea monophora]|uniref:Zn(2)-C6 fungal-type domain-containing protein n=1 Tax=Fonsecaea monophora TaxID=254056 RepID=A0A177FKW8_9EURO|nr:hypothetical protein AYO21_01697 [Fonsecaea monophora]KAH0845040.1 hypothetical protein FOPE_09295 [Fonsecaea pedrosoi]OAG44240.1 hypothetical protein AYO21_01697 [Fonsecaea monophora]
MAQARRSAPKARTRTFTGCLTCRTRKVKCDLHRPSCNNCIRLSLQCRGYQVQLQWLPVWDPEQPDSTSPGNSTTEGAAAGGEGRRTRTEIFDAHSRSRFSEDLVRHLSTGQNPQQHLDQVLDRLDEQVKESKHSRVDKKGWQISKGPFSVLQLVPALVPVSVAENVEALEQSEMTIQLPESMSSLDGDREAATACLDGIDWSLSVADNGVGSQALFAETPAGASYNYSFTNAAYTPLIEGKEGSSYQVVELVPVAQMQQTGTNIPGTSTPFQDDIQLSQPRFTGIATYGHPAASSLSNGSPYVPSNVRFLLSHYMNHVISSLSGLPHNEAPWKSIHVPYAMTAYGELDIMGQSGFARVSLLYSLLSLTCYHLATLYKPAATVSGTDTTQLLSTDDQATNLQYWNSQGLKFREIARTAFRKCLQAMSTEQPEQIKYKELFVSAMNLICTGIVSGDPWDSRLFILQCEEIVNKIGRKKEAFSKKALQLHRIFAYIRVIEKTTFVQTRDQYLVTLGKKPMLANEVELVKKIPEDSFPYSTTLASNYETWSDLGLSGPEEESFNDFYGMPASILKLIARTNNMVAQVDPPQHHGTSQPYMPASLVDAAAALERDICNWETPQRPAESGGDNNSNNSNPFDLLSCSSAESMPDPSQTMKSNIATAMHHALMVYFFRFVRGTNPIILQHYVESILSNLEMHHESKQCFFPGVRLGVTVWPSFIAACEALGDSLRRRAILCMRHAAWAGFQNAEAAEMVAKEVWRRRDAGELHVSWSTVLRESQTILLLT